MKLESILKYFFNYNSQNNHNFKISASPNNISNKQIKKPKVFKDFNKNLEYLKSCYSLSINSDINTREFEIEISSKKFKACLIFIDGMVKSESLNLSILSPLLLKNSIETQNFKTLKLRNTEKFNLKSFLLKKLIPQNTIKISEDFDDITKKINSGFSVLFVETLDVAFCIEAKDIQGRSISEPQTESVIRGPHAAFIENLRTNTSLIRKIINNENLIIESLNIGEITRNTSCCLLYEKHNKQ